MEQDYRPPDDNRMAGSVSGVGVGFKDVHGSRAPRGGWDGMGGDLRPFHQEGGIGGFSYGQTQKVVAPIDASSLPHDAPLFRHQYRTVERTSKYDGGRC